MINEITPLMQEIIRMRDEQGRKWKEIAEELRARQLRKTPYQRQEVKTIYLRAQRYRGCGLTQGQEQVEMAMIGVRKPEFEHQGSIRRRQGFGATRRKQVG